MQRPARKKQSPSPCTSNSASGLKCNEDEVANEVALHAEIDKILEEKAAKNNLSVVNVKSVIRQVVQDQMVQKMIAATVKRKERAEKRKYKERSASGENESSEDDDELDYFEPKLTRAKTKELLESQTQPQFWPMSPGKLLGNIAPAHEPSEAQILMNEQDLPDESEAEDEEYIPTEADFHPVSKTFAIVTSKVNTLLLAFVRSHCM
jgi:beta-glucosidase-like glycosyl hydrolase